MTERVHAMQDVSLAGGRGGRGEVWGYAHEGDTLWNLFNRDSGVC